MKRLAIAASGPRERFVRKPVDPFAVPSEHPPGARPSEDSWEVAKAISIRLGPDAAVIERYLAALSRAPASHLNLIRRRGGRIFFAPTIADGLGSMEATSRRGRPLRPYEVWDLTTQYSEKSGTAGVFDLEVDALVFPTTYVARDIEAVVLHELGHALTMPVATIRPALLKDLPEEIAWHVERPGYRDPDSRNSMRSRIFEALAQGYVYVLLERHDELPAALLSELTFILNTIEDRDRIRFDF